MHPALFQALVLLLTAGLVEASVQVQADPVIPHAGLQGRVPGFFGAKAPSLGIDPSLSPRLFRRAFINDELHSAPPSFNNPSGSSPGHGHDDSPHGRRSNGDAHPVGPGTLIPRSLHAFDEAALRRMLLSVRHERQQAVDDTLKLRVDLERDHGLHVDAVMRERVAALGWHGVRDKKHPDGRVKDAFIANRQAPKAEWLIGRWCQRNSRARDAERSVALLEAEMRARGLHVPPEEPRSRFATPWEGWRAEQEHREWQRWWEEHHRQAQEHRQSVEQQQHTRERWRRLAEQQLHAHAPSRRVGSPIEPSGVRRYDDPRQDAQQRAPEEPGTSPRVGHAERTGPSAGGGQPPRPPRPLRRTDDTDPGWRQWGQRRRLRQLEEGRRDVHFGEASSQSESWENR